MREMLIYLLIDCFTNSQMNQNNSDFSSNEILFFDLENIDL